MYNVNLPFLPERTQKPRKSGVTMVMDKGISLRQAEDNRPPVPVDEIERMIEERHAARRRRDFAAADLVRDDLAARGVLLEDSAGGTRWKRK